MDPFLGEVRMFAGNFAPAGWLICDGSSQQISQFEALYTLIGTTYGGDGQVTFNLPDLRGRTPIHQGRGPGLSPRTIGDTLGAESVSLTPVQMPQHFHPVNISTAAADSVAPVAGSIFAASQIAQYATNPTNASMAPSATTTAGEGAPHDNMMPFQVLSFIIATAGVFPARP